MSKDTAQTVLDAATDLRNANQMITREELTKITGLKQSIVDDRISHLIGNDKLYRLKKGVFAMPPDHHEPRIITVTFLPCGIISIEIGDDHVIALVPKETRTLGKALGPLGVELSAIQLGEEAAHMRSQLSLEIKAIRRQVNTLRAVVNKVLGVVNKIAGTSFAIGESDDA